MIGIYKITSPSNKVYIGQSQNLNKRVLQYKGNHCRKQIRLYNSILKYGWINHKFEILELCSFQDLNKKERYYQDFYNVLSEKGLNCVLTATDVLPARRSQETKDKISKTTKGRKQSKEYLEKRKALNIRFNHTEETKKKLSVSHMNKAMLDTTRQKIKEANQIKVIDTLTGRIFESIKEASKHSNIKYLTLMRKLKGITKNNTSLTYLKSDSYETFRVA